MSVENPPKESASLELSKQVAKSEDHSTAIEPEVLERLAGQVATRAIMISRESYSGPMQVRVKTTLGRSMKKEYDFSKALKNPYASQLKK